MKKTVLLVVLGIFVAFNAFSQCTPNEGCEDLLNPGEICPMAFDSGYVNVPYTQTITFIPPATYNYSGMDLTVQKIVINTVTGLPDGIEWATNATEFIPTDPITRYCGVMFGTPTTAGEYPFHFTATVTVLLGSMPIPVSVNETQLDYSPLLVILPENQAPPVAEFSATPVTSPGGEVITFTDNSFNATAWEWTFEGANVTTSNEQNPTAVWNSMGTYDVTLTVTNGNCDPPKTDTYVATDYINITTNVFINPDFSKICTIYPNPSDGIVIIEGANITSIMIYNALGQVVYSAEPNSGRVEVDLSHLKKGAYFVNVCTEKGNAHTGLTLE